MKRFFKAIYYLTRLRLVKNDWRAYKIYKDFFYPHNKDMQLFLAQLPMLALQITAIKSKYVKLILPNHKKQVKKYKKISLIGGIIKDRFSSENVSHLLIPGYIELAHYLENFANGLNKENKYIVNAINSRGLDLKDFFPFEFFKSRYGLNLLMSGLNPARDKIQLIANAGKHNDSKISKKRLLQYLTTHQLGDSIKVSKEDFERDVLSALDYCKGLMMAEIYITTFFIAMCKYNSLAPEEKGASKEKMSELELTVLDRILNELQVPENFDLKSVIRRRA